MICPRCAVGDISDQTHECTLCGFSPAGVATLADPFPRELEASARRDLEHEFQIEGVLGQGPRGVVYLALEREQNRLVALKIIPRTPGMAPEADVLLQREASLAASLDHPHIVPIYRAGATRIFLWYVMEYSNGRSLADAITATDQTADVRDDIRRNLCNGSKERVADPIRKIDLRADRGAGSADAAREHGNRLIERPHCPILEAAVRLHLSYQARILVE